MEQQYAQKNYIDDLDALIHNHKKTLVILSSEQHVVEGFITSITAKCDSLADKIKKMDADENINSDEILSEERNNLCQEIMSSMAKLKWFREQLTLCKSKAEQCQLELDKLLMQRLHVSVFHGI